MINIKRSFYSSKLLSKKKPSCKRQPYHFSCIATEKLGRTPTAISKYKHYFKTKNRSINHFECLKKLGKNSIEFYLTHIARLAILIRKARDKNQYLPEKFLATAVKYNRSCIDMKNIVNN